MATGEDKRQEEAPAPQGAPDNSAVDWLVAVVGAICLFYSLPILFGGFRDPSHWVALGVVVLCAFGRTATLRVTKRLYRKTGFIPFALTPIVTGLIIYLIYSSPEPAPTVKDMGGKVKVDQTGAVVELDFFQERRVSRKPDPLFEEFKGVPVEAFYEPWIRSNVTDAGMVCLKGMTKLKKLNLRGQFYLTDTGLAHLKGLSDLQALDIMGADVTDAGLVHLKGLTKLQTLNLSYTTEVTDAVLVHLKGMTGLEILGLENTQVTDAGLVHLEELTNLQSLELGGTKVTDAGLKHLKGLTKLQTLNLGSTKVTDAGLVHLKGLTELEKLFLYNTEITDAGLTHLKGLTTLEVLNIWDNLRLTDAGLVHLKGLTKLYSLNLRRTKVTAAGVKELQQALPNCKILH